MTVADAVEGYAWLAAWFALNVGVTLMNKAFFQWFGFSFPIALSLVHMVCSAIGSEVVLRTGAYETKQLSTNEHIQMLLFSLLFSSNIVVGNSALKYVPVSLVQVVRSVIPGLTLILSMLVLGKTYSSNYYWTILLIILGVALASIGELEFHFVGFLLTVLVCFLSSLKSVVSQKFLVGKLQFHPFELLQRMSWLSALQMLIMSLIMEKEAISEWWRANYTDAAVGEGLNGTQFTLLLLANGAMAFLLNYANFMTTKKTSALTVTVAGNVKHILTILLSVMMFKNPISLLNGVGTLVTLVGAVVYSFLEYNEKALTAQLNEAVAFVRSQLGSFTPSVALILGSGLGDLANQITEERRVIQYSAIPHFRQSKVHGHSNCLVAGKLNGVNVIVQQGRFHAYEGIAMQELVFPLRVLFLLGAHTLIVTNAAGGVNKAFQPGNLMLITDHVNFMGENPLTGDNIDSLGPRFCDMSFAYAKQLQEVARAAAKKLSIDLREGVYFAMKGPSYETPAEIRMIRTCGGDAVGMSTVPEVIAASHMGMRVLGISCITNMAAGILDRALDHAEVIETSNHAKRDFQALITACLPELATAPPKPAAAAASTH